jgi:hypothetical protein
MQNEFILATVIYSDGLQQCQHDALSEQLRFLIYYAHMYEMIEEQCIFRRLIIQTS